MERRPGLDGGPGDEPGVGVGLPGAPGQPPRDYLPSGFARGGAWDTCPPSAALARAVEQASTPEWRCAGASRDELIGLLRRYAALEAWAAAGRLGVLRALIRDEGQPLPGGGWHGDLPDGWTKSLTYEAAAALAVSVPTAEAMMWLAWDLRVRLPGLAGLLADGTLTYAKVRAVAETFQLLSDEDAARAEALIVPELPGKNYGQVKRLAEQAAVTVDPEAATRRREHAERERARVTVSREESGAAALSGRDLPTGDALAAHGHVCDRARQYQDSGAFPGVRLDQLRATAYLDILNGTTAAVRIASARPADDTHGNVNPSSCGPAGSGHAPGPAKPGPADPDAGISDAGISGSGVSCGAASSAVISSLADQGACTSGAVSPGPGGPGPSGRHGGTGEAGPRCVHAGANQQDRAGHAGNQSQGNGPEGDGTHPGGSPGTPPGSPGAHPPGEESSAPPTEQPSTEPPPRPAELVIPLATLLGLAGRPGEGHGLGPLDPGLCRDLAASAVRSPHSRLCVTVTDPDGVTIGHGCARRPRRRDPAQAAHGPFAGSVDGVVAALPARINLTIPATRLAALARHAHGAVPPGAVPAGSPGSNGGWTGGSAAAGPGRPPKTAGPPPKTAVPPLNTAGPPPRTADPVPGNAAGGAPWSFAATGGQGPPADGFGTWTLTLPDGRRLTVDLGPVPTFDCDHRHESPGYQPNGTLRHLVQVRDGDCTFPVCSRHARETDFEHAVPYDQGGRTCACNAGARSRQCHRVKQSPGWQVTQPRPGWHQWETPAGRTYTQGPKRYPD